MYRIGNSNCKRQKVAIMSNDVKTLPLGIVNNIPNIHTQSHMLLQASTTFGITTVAGIYEQKQFFC